MHRQNLVLWCFTLLFVASCSKLQGNSTTTSNSERNDSIITRYENHANVTTTNRSDVAEAVRYKTHENSMRNNDDMQYEFRADSKNNDHEHDDSVQYEFHEHSKEEVSLKNHEGGNQMPMKPHTNSTEADDKSNLTSHESCGNLTQIEDKSNSTSYKLSEKLYQDNVCKINVIPFEMCENSTCILLCCPVGSRLINEECIAENTANYALPDVYEYMTNDSLAKRSIGKVDQIFELAVHDPCDNERYVLDPKKSLDDEYMFLANGSLYRPNIIEIVESYCLAVLQQDRYEIAVCFEFMEELQGDPRGIPEGLIVSLPFLLITFVVYSILPDLQNMHGYTLRGYIGSLFVAYTFLSVNQLSETSAISDTACIVIAFIIHFSFLASFFWLNVMCFDIWWRIGSFRSLQESVKQRERKKFIMYSIYAWGSASILTIVCIIMDFAPGIPVEYIRPEIGVTKCWFNTDKARALYFYGPMSVTVICNICLFISTALKILRHKKDTAHHLGGSESRRHDDNKQWFNLYLKLFIVMGINWSMEVISWHLLKSAPPYVWYLTDLTNTLQGPIIFIIFVWKEKIWRLLLRRFGCQDSNIFSRNSTQSGGQSSASRTCTTTSGVMSLQKVNPYAQTNSRAKSSSDEAD